MTKLSRRTAWLLLAISGLSLAVAWVVASPVGASPDEPAHISYAWATVTGQTVSGEHLTIDTLGRTVTSVRLPQKLLQYPEPGCYAFKPGQPVTQCSPIPADNRQTSAQNSYMSRYPPLFYAFEGVVLRSATAVNLSGPRVLYGARLASAALSLFAVGFGVFLLSRRFPDDVVVLATLLALPASAWFLASSVNPNGLEIAAAFLLAAGVLSVSIDSFLGVRSLSAVLAVPLGTLLLAWTRPLSWVWAALILGLLLLPTRHGADDSWWRRLPVRRLGAVAGTATALLLGSAMVWFGYALQIHSQEARQASPAAWTALNPVGRVILLVLNSGSIVSDQVGIFGWLDTPLPSLAVLSWVSVCAVAATIWVVGRNRFVPHWAVGVILGLGCLAAMLDEYHGAWGWQGRYLLPLTAGVCVLSLPGLTKGLERLSALKRVVPWMLVVLMAVNALSVVWFLFRNVYGVKAWKRLPSTPLPVGTPSWTPPFGQGTVFALVGLVLISGVVGVWAIQAQLQRQGGLTAHHPRGVSR